MILNANQLATFRREHKDKKIVLGSGAFDLIHYGHVKYIQSLREHGDIVVVAVRSDDVIRTHKHHTRPVIPEQDRVRMVDAIKGVDYAFIPLYDSQRDSAIDHSPEAMFTALQPDVFVTTNEEWYELRDIIPGELIVLPRPEETLSSTTAIIEQIQKLPLR